jgi:hypothetical protein
MWNINIEKMGQHTLLRTMTRKSLIKFGRYADYTVDQLIQLDKRHYLRWIYYNCEQITFTDDVLDLIHISEMQIDKPGKDEKTGDAVREFLSQFVPKSVKKHYEWKNKQVAKSKLANLGNSTRNLKSYLQGRNHGR